MRTLVRSAIACVIAGLLGWFLLYPSSATAAPSTPENPYGYDEVLSASGGHFTNREVYDAALKRWRDPPCYDPVDRASVLRSIDLAISDAERAYEQSKAFGSEYSRKSMRTTSDILGDLREARLAVSRKPSCSDSEWAIFTGVLLGKRWADNDWNATQQTTLNAVDVLANATTRFSSDPVRVKLVVGAERPIWQTWVLGVEWDVAFGRNSATQARIPGTWGAGGIATAAAALNDSITVNQDWDTSVRAKLGTYVYQSLLVYGTAGVDFLRISASVNCTLAGACGAVGTPVFASASTVQAGFVFGAGFDYRITRQWVARFEYLHANLGTWAATFGSPATFQTIADIKVQTDTVMAGFLYRF